MKAAIALLGILVAIPAWAVDFKVGPSCSLTKVSAGGTVALAPGVGVQGGLDFGPGKWSLDAALFGNALQAISNGHTADGGELSAAIFGCYTQFGVCAGPAFVLAGPNGGAFGGFSWRQSFGFVLGLNWDALSALHIKTATP